LFQVQLQTGTVMEDGKFQNMLCALTSLLPAQLVALDAALRPQMAVVRSQIAGAPAPSPVPAAAPTASQTPHTAPSIAAIKASFKGCARVPALPVDGGQEVGLGQRLGRYRCRQCGVTFNALTGTPLAQLHKRKLWAAHAQTLVEGIALRKVAERIGVDLTTAFRWRHRFLRAPKSLESPEA
jgi:hypothetical protein